MTAADGRRVLLLSQLVPYPPDAGAKLKTWNLVKWLGGRCQLTLVAFSRGETAAALDPLRRHCAALHTVPLRRGLGAEVAALAAALWTGRPWVIERDRRAAMHALLRRLTAAQAFDVVHVDQLAMAQYAHHARGAVTVLDAHNASWLLYRRLADGAPPGLRRLLWSREARRLRDYEAAVGRRADAVLAVSDADRDALREAMGAAVPITVIPIGVDVDELQPLRRAPAADRVLYIGTMFWPPNVDAVDWFLRAIWPRIRAARPAARCTVVGARPPRRLRAYAAPGSGVRFTGYLSDPSTVLRETAVVVVPLRAGAGMRVKILTALAQALPVVTTAIGCEGIEAEPGRDLLIADTAERFAAATLRLLDDRRLADELGGRGRRLIESRYDYRRLLAALEPIYGWRAAAPSGPP